MGVVHIYLENGFDRDTVTIDAGAQRRTESDVTTRYQIGLARAVELTVPDAGRVTLTIALPERDVAAAATIDPAVTAHVRASVVEGSLAVRAEKDPPGFA